MEKSIISTLRASICSIVSILIAIRVKFYRTLAEGYTQQSYVLTCYPFKQQSSFVRGYIYHNIIFQMLFPCTMMVQIISKKRKKPHTRNELNELCSRWKTERRRDICFDHLLFFLLVNVWIKKRLIGIEKTVITSRDHDHVIN